MEICVNIEVLLCLLKDEAELTRSRRERGLPMPAGLLDTEDLHEVYNAGWKTGFWHGAECVIDNLRNLVEE